MGHLMSCLGGKTAADDDHQLIDEAPAVPCSLKEFKILEEVGSGAFAQVYRAVHKRSKQEFAIKAVAKKVYWSSSGEHEAEIMRRLPSHPFVVRLWNSFTSFTHVYLVLDFLPGGDLAALMFRQRRRRLNEDMARFYMAEIVCAVGHLHRNGVLHGDIKPENVVLDEDGHVKLIDMGMAEELQPGGGQCLRRGGRVRGTVLYMAPEIARGEEYGHAADWWSVGIVLYEMLVGRTPFEPSCVPLDRKHIRSCIGDQHGCITLPSFLSKDAHSLLTALLRKDPNRRLRSEHMIKSHPWFAPIHWGNLVALL